MLKTNYLRGVLFLALLAFLALNFCSCADMVAGRRYTLAKVDRKCFLVESHKVLDKPINVVGNYEFTAEQLVNFPDLVRMQGQPIQTDTVDSIIKPRKCIGINLNRGYIRYLQSVMRPEIAIFARTRIHDRANPDNDFVYERVLLASEKKGADIMLNKDSTIPQIDLPILPPIEYNGEDLTVEIRVIELKQKNNERVKQLINAAASTAATLKPEAAAAVSIFQTVLTFLESNNSDDIEFMLDFHISADSDTMKFSAGSVYDLTMTPRIGTYVMIKTEHPERTIYPKRYFDYLPDAVRLGLAEVLKIGTLNAANVIYKWHENDGNGETLDVYEGGMGYPYGVKRRTYTEPVFYDNGDFTLYSDQEFNKRFTLIDNELYLEELPNMPPKFNNHSSTIESREGQEKEVPGGRLNKSGRVYPFRDQSYFVFSIISPQTGTPMEVVRKQAVAHSEIDDLGINTQQATPEEWREQLSKITNSVKGLALVKYIHQKYDSKIAKATSPEQLTKALEEQKTDLDKLDTLLTPETIGGAKIGFSKDISDILKPELNDLYKQKVLDRAIDLQKAEKTETSDNTVEATPGEIGVSPPYVYSDKKTQNFLLSTRTEVESKDIHKGRIERFDNLSAVSYTKISKTTGVLNNVNIHNPGNYAFYINNPKNPKTGGYTVPYHVVVKPELGYKNWSSVVIDKSSPEIRLAKVEADTKDLIKSIVIYFDKALSGLFNMENPLLEYFKKAGKDEFTNGGNADPGFVTFKTNSSITFQVNTSYFIKHQCVGLKLRNVKIRMTHGLEDVPEETVSK